MGMTLLTPWAEHVTSCGKLSTPNRPAFHLVHNPTKDEPELGFSDHILAGGCGL